MKFKILKRNGYTLKHAQSIPYRGYRDIRIPEGMIGRATELGTKPLPVLREEAEEKMGSILADDPTMQQADEAVQKEEEGTAPSKGKFYAGIGLGLAGIAGGVLTAFKWGAMGTGLKVAAATASVGAAGGGATLAVIGSKEAEIASKDEQKKQDAVVLQDILLTRIPPVKVTAQIQTLVANYDNWIDPHWKVRPRPHVALPCEIRVIGDGTPTEMRDKFEGFAPFTNRSKTLAQDIKEREAAGQTIKEADRRIAADPGGFRCYGTAASRESLLNSGMVELTHVESISDSVTAKSWMDPTDKVNIWINRTKLLRNESVVCTINHHRYRGSINLYGWFPSTFDIACAARGCRRRDDRPWIEWGKHLRQTASGDLIEESYDNYMGSGHPPLGFFMDIATNPWLASAQSNLVSADLPEAVDTQTSGPKEVSGPMMAILRAYRTLKGASPECTGMTWPGPEEIFHMTVGGAKKRDRRAWWMQVGDLIGTVFGIASFVCEIATPIITCINPALGAAIGTGMSAATGILGGIKDAVEGRPGGIYNAIDEVAGIIPSELQARLKAGWSEAGSELGDVYSEIEAAVVGWRDAGGQFMQQVGDLNGGSDFFQVMTEAMTPEESYKTMVHDIYSVTSRQVLKNFNIEDAPFKVGWVGNYTHVPPEWKDNPFPKIDPSRYYGALGSTGVPFIGPGL